MRVQRQLPGFNGRLEDYPNPPTDDVFSWNGGETRERRRLEKRFSQFVVAAPQLRLHTTFVPNKRQPVFNWYDYKQGFSSGLVDYFIDEWGLKTGDALFDPFVGCGTTLLTARRRGLAAAGVEFVPTSLLAARTKLSQMDRRLADALLRCTTPLSKTKPVRLGSIPVDVVLLAKAFEPRVLCTLWGIARAIRRKRDRRVRALLQLALFSILEKTGSALKDGNSIKIVQKKGTVEPREAFVAAVARLVGDIRKEVSWLRTKENQFVVLGDARALPFARRRFDALVTSPPYLNRYDYVRLYSMEEAFGFGRTNPELISLRKRQFRGHVETKYDDSSFSRLSPAEREVCENLAGQRLNNPKILDMVAGYFEDLEAAVKQTKRVMKPGAPVAWVVGNVVHGAEHIPVDYFMADILTRNNFVVETILLTRFKGNSSQHMARHGRYPVRESIVCARRS